MFCSNTTATIGGRGCQFGQRFRSAYRSSALELAYLHQDREDTTALIPHPCSHWGDPDGAHPNSCPYRDQSVLSAGRSRLEGILQNLALRCDFGAQSPSEFNGLQPNSLCHGTGNFFEGIRENFRGNREFASRSLWFSLLSRSMREAWRDHAEDRTRWPFSGGPGSGAVAEKLHMLAALRLLGDGLGKLEKQHQQRIERGDKPADVDREIAQAALTGVVTFFLDHGIESQPLVRLLSELAALSAGASPSAMLAPTVTRHRRPDAPTIEEIKGRLAAIMEFRQQAGLTRKAAGEWVARHITSKLKRQLGSVTRATVDSWLAKWGGHRGMTPGSGRDGYLHMHNILADRKPTEQQLKKIVEVLARSLPS
jgi:hypothetical protein